MWRRPYDIAVKTLVVVKKVLKIPDPPCSNVVLFLCYLAIRDVTRRVDVGNSRQATRNVRKGEVVRRILVRRQRGFVIVYMYLVSVRRLLSRRACRRFCPRRS